MSAADIAYWDLRSRAAGQPLFRALGAYSDSVRIYGSGRSAHQLTTDELVTASHSWVDEGYTALKVRVGARNPHEDLDRVSAVRQAIGPGTLLMLDANGRLDLPTATWLARECEDLGIFWIEEPLPAADVRGYAVLSARTSVPIATGEHLHAVDEFAVFARERTATILQPDAPLAGGISG